MEPTYIYPGSFCPPTYGHLRVVERAAEIFPEVIILCSTNDEKGATRWFSEVECEEMWKNYPLPENVSVRSFSRGGSREKLDPKSIVMIRGIRNEDDLESEKNVVQLNKKLFNIDKYFYILAEDKFINISSTLARKSASELDYETLVECVIPNIVDIVLQKALELGQTSLIQKQKEIGYEKRI